jgi:sec-independent protein translocase protein TatB
MIVIAIIALIVIGPKQLPQVAATVGRMLNEFRRATSDLTGSFIETRDSFNHTRPKFEKEPAASVTTTIEVSPSNSDSDSGSAPSSDSDSAFPSQADTHSKTDSTGRKDS